MGIADDFIFSKQRKLAQYRRKKRLANGEEPNFGTFVTQKEQLELLKTKQLHAEEEEEEADFDQYHGENPSSEEQWEVPFDKQQLLQFMEELETSNLFLMNMIEEDELHLKN